jgi:hypothetical protein
MDDQELRDLLENLHTEIQHTNSVDEKGRELLHDLEGDIRDLLERSESLSEQSNPSVILRLEESIYHFEATHPTLSEQLTRLMAVLSNAGI